MITTAKQLLQQVLDDGPEFDDFSELLHIKELIARIETDMARGHERYELEEAGCSASAAYRIDRRATNPWHQDVPVEHQDAILSALEKLTTTSPRRQDIYTQCATEARHASVKATREHAKRLVREENERLARDPFEAHRQRHFTIRTQDEHGGCRITGYLPATTSALLKALTDRALGADRPTNNDDDPRTLPQRRADALEHVLRWASSDRVITTGHCSLVVSTIDSDGFDWRSRFATNVGIDLNLFDIDNLSGDWISDYIAVHDHHGAIKHLISAGPSATFHQRIALLARDLVCQHPGCNAPASECDAHHVLAWLFGGKTDINNLALLCRKHHAHNDDSRLEAHLEITLGRAIHISNNGTARPNTSPAARRSGAHRITEKPPD